MNDEGAVYVLEACEKLVEERLDVTYGEVLRGENELVEIRVHVSSRRSENRGQRLEVKGYTFQVKG